MRLDKYIATVSDFSRSEVKRYIKGGEVCINALIATNGAQTVRIAEDQVTLFGRLLSPPTPRYFMLNKPPGTICATEDSQHPTVLDLFDEPNYQRLQIVGRLDKETTGLLLLTDDGQWNHRATSPKRQCFKVYHVCLAEPISAAAIQQLERGVALKHEARDTLPAKVNRINEQEIELSIQEGKYHQVKRMLAAVGNHVTALHRQQVGDIRLDKQLAPGNYRPLTPTEIAAFSL